MCLSVLTSSVFSFFSGQLRNHFTSFSFLKVFRYDMFLVRVIYNSIIGEKENFLPFAFIQFFYCCCCCCKELSKIREKIFIFCVLYGLCDPLLFNCLCEHSDRFRVPVNSLCVWYVWKYYRYTGSRLLCERVCVCERERKKSVGIFSSFGQLLVLSKYKHMVIILLNPEMEKKMFVC